MASIIKADNIQKVSDGSNIIKKCGSTITLGSCGATISLAAGATQTGFGRTGTVDWCTTAKTAPFTGVSGNGYFVNTTSGVVTVTLPASPSAGDIVAIKDYAKTFDTNNVTVGRNSSKIGGQCTDATLSTEGLSATLVYVDGTQGWLVVNDGLQSQAPTAAYITATGGTVTTCGDFKIHTFTADGCFSVSNAGNACGSNKIEYMVVAGGGGGGSAAGGGGGGAGGYRESSGVTAGCYSVSPLGACVSALTASVATFPITVGAGGTAGSASKGGSGATSIFSTISSAGGGGGTGNCQDAVAGGSGGGGGFRPPGSPASGAAGNTPPVSPPQGNPGGDANPSTSNPDRGGGGGGATAAGTTPSGGSAGPGGAGATSSINGTPTVRAGGGGGGKDEDSPNGGTSGNGGPGGGGQGSSSDPANLRPGTAGSVNTGGGGGGGGAGPGAGPDGYAGGSGIVILRYKFQ